MSWGNYPNLLGPLISAVLRQNSLQTTIFKENHSQLCFPYIGRRYEMFVGFAWPAWGQFSCLPGPSGP